MNRLLVILLAVVLPLSASADRRRSATQGQGESATVQLGAEARTFAINNADGAPWLDSLSTPDTIYNESSLSRFVDDDNEGPLTAPQSSHPLAMVMEDGDVYFVASGTITGYAGKIQDFKTKYYYVAHDVYRWKHDAPENHIVTSIAATHRCDIASADNDHKYNFDADDCTAPYVTLLNVNGNYYAPPSTPNFGDFNPAFNLFYRRVLTADNYASYGSGTSAWELRWGFHFGVRVGCTGSTYGPCSQWASAYDGVTERGVAAWTTFAVWPNFTPPGKEFRQLLVPPVHGFLNVGRSMDILASQAVSGPTATLTGALQIEPGGKVEILHIDFGDRLRTSVGMGRYEDDPLTTSAFAIMRFDPNAPYAFATDINDYVRPIFSQLASGEFAVLIAPTLGASIAIDTVDLTPPFNISYITNLGGPGGFGAINLDARAVAYNFPVPPKPRYFLEDLRLKEGQSE